MYTTWFRRGNLVDTHLLGKDDAKKRMMVGAESE